MKTTKKERESLRELIDDTIDRTASEINDEPDIPVRAGALLHLLDDADRCAELEAELTEGRLHGGLKEIVQETIGQLRGEGHLGYPTVIQTAHRRIAELEDAYTTADADAAGWATKCEALEAELARIKDEARAFVAYAWKFYVRWEGEYTCSNEEREEARADWKQRIAALIGDEE